MSKIIFLPTPEIMDTNIKEEKETKPTKEKVI